MESAREAEGERAVRWGDSARALVCVFLLCALVYVVRVVKV